MSEQEPQHVDAEDLGIALTGFTLSFIAALHRQPKMSANEILDALAEETPDIRG
jgi:uncharacterized protein YidB (DUF937 family)